MQSTTYAPAQKALHWMIFLLVIGLYGLTYGEDFFPRGDPGRATIWWLHISFGLLLAALVAVRVAMRLRRGAPSLPAAMSEMEQKLAHVAHLLLYALLVIIPVVGIFLTWFRGDALTFFGLFTIPSPVTPDRDTAGIIREAHSLCANLILIVVGVHAAAALWHHFIRKDEVLRRMLPGT
ncbi:cytochrome b561 [Mesorhizobium soli]|uniref:cytochrome b n=1 Tax=Pseudaminobacter soli (ex Li et al. 2025) TaxID=1295366 RepID=UPI002473D0D5|nr:cytochrome b [Mesorhizobium soli]MDH6234128.1 cytochrome b561 [Mesorhizobium soli]